MKVTRSAFRPARCIVVAAAGFLAAVSQAAPVAAPAAAPAVDPAVATIDRLVEQNLVKAGLKANAPASDEVFLRRIYFDIIGRIPTAQEASEFLNNKAPDKRAKLIDKLLTSDGYVSHWYNFWADILRIKSNPTEGAQEGSGDAYAAWVKDELRKNTPYNKFVYGMLTAQGYIWDGGAVGYYMRDAGMPLDNMANTCQIFLGTRVACAQCHNHPFDAYHQRDFYEMAAYTVGVQTRVQARNIIAEANGKKDLNRSAAAKLVQPGVVEQLDEMLEPLRYGVRGNYDAHQYLPPDFRGDPKNPSPREGKPGELVKPVPVFGKRSEIKTNKHILENYAAWMTSPENPTFTVVIANRLWKQSMGLGLIEPVDDIKKVDIEKNGNDASKLASNPALMSFLTQHMKTCGYDMKRFLRTIFNTRSYQREATTADIPAIEDYKFPGPVLRRLTAEQLWDSMVTFVIPEPDLRRGSFAYARDLAQMKAAADALQDKLQAGRGKALIELATALARIESEFDPKVAPWRQKLADARSKDDKAGVSAAEAEIEKIEAARFDARKKVYDEQDAKMTKMSSGGGIFDKKPAAMMPAADKMAKMEKSNEPPPSAADDKWQGYGAEWVRASELPSPAPGGHFLREFGQSEREIIQNGNRDSSVTQALLMLNGPLFNQLTAKNTRIGKVLDATKTPDEKRDELFLTILSRPPNDREKALVAKQIQDGGAGAFRKVAWALLNTREFSFVQ